RRSSSRRCCGARPRRPCTAPRTSPGSWSRGSRSRGTCRARTCATCSSCARRRLQLGMLFQDLQFSEIRGNVDTRLKKIAEQHVADGTVLAAAGLNRLGITSWPGLEFRPFGFTHMVPAVGQGALAVQCRAADAAGFASIFDADTERTVSLERAFQQKL